MSYEDLTWWEKPFAWAVIVTGVVAALVVLVLMAPFLLLERLGAFEAIERWRRR